VLIHDELPLPSCPVAVFSRNTNNFLCFRKYFVRAESWIAPRHGARVFSKIVVGEEATVVVGLKPMVEMDLIEVGRDQFLSQFVSFGAQKGNLRSGENGNKRLCDTIKEISLRSMWP